LQAGEHVSEPSGSSAVRPEQLASLAVFADIPVEDLAPLATKLEPLRAAPGEVLMRQGDPARSFVIIAAGRIEIRHVGSDSEDIVVQLPAGIIVGEIALLRDTPRTATAIAWDEVRGYVGYGSAFESMLAIPGITERLIRTARQRLAAFITPIPVRINDGTELFLRPVLPGDSERFGGGGAAMSPRTLYTRFLSARPTGAVLPAYLFEVDYVDHFVWVVTVGVDGPVVADARFVRNDANPASAEIAITVVDAYQDRGVGEQLLCALAIAARLDGIERFEAIVLSDNLAARAMGDKFHVRWKHDEPGVVTTTTKIPGLDELLKNCTAHRHIYNVARQVIHALD
jgi:CRP-like cAMP-binding protein